jgi:hypothetical protein
VKVCANYIAVVALVAVGTLVGCSLGPAKSTDASGSVRNLLDQAGLKDVTASQDRGKGVVTLEYDNCSYS